GTFVIGWFRTSGWRRRTVGGIAVIAVGHMRSPWWQTFHDVVDLVGINGFPLQQSLGHGMHLVAVVLDQLAGNGVLLVDDLANLGVHFLHGGFGHVRCFGNAAAQEDLAFVLGVYNRTQGVRHAVASHDVTSNLRCTLKVVRCAGGHLIHEHFFSDTATEQHGNHVQQALFVHAVAIAFRQLHGDTQSTTTRNDGDFVNRVRLGQHASHQSVTGFVVSSVATLFLGHDHGAAFCTHDDLVLGALEVLHIHGATVTACSEQSSFVNQVGQISTGKTRRTTSQHHGVHIGSQRHFAHVYFQNLLATTDVRQADHHLTVKTARTQQSGVQYVR